MTVAELERRARALGLLACRVEMRFLGEGRGNVASVLLWSTNGVEAIREAPTLERAAEAALSVVEERHRLAEQQTTKTTS